MSFAHQFAGQGEFYPGSSRRMGAPQYRLNTQPEVRWDDNPKILKVRGVDVEMFSIGDLAKALGNRKPVTIRKWETEGVIPPPPFRLPSEHKEGKRRLYTRAHVEGMMQIAADEGILIVTTSPKMKPISKTQFKQRVWDLFRQLQAAK